MLERELKILDGTLVWYWRWFYCVGLLLLVLLVSVVLGQGML